MTSEFTDWATDLLQKFSKQFQDGAEAHLEKLLGSPDLSGLGKTFEELLKGIDVEALGRLAGTPTGRGQASAYEVLGLPETASDQEIRERYRELAMRLHPDKAGKAGEYLFKLVSAAYQQIGKQRGFSR